MLSPQILAELQTVLMGGVMCWSIGRLVHWFIGKVDKTKRIHGQFIPEWIGASYIGSGLLAFSWSGPSPNVPAPPSLIFANFGLFIGLAAGWIHGNIRLRLHQAWNEESEPFRPNDAPDDGNPYRPP